jgi:hypothetical protein
MLKIPFIFEELTKRRDMKLKLLTLAWILSGISLYGQDPVAQKYGQMITPADLKDYLSILASDAFEGRETGKRGQKIAAAFVSSHFQEIGLTGPVNGSYYQPVALYTSIPGDIYVKTGQTRFDNYSDITYYGSADTGGEISLPIVFAGKGRKEDFDQLDVKGKAVIVMLSSEGNYREPLDMARQKDAKIVFGLHPDVNAYRELVEQIKDYTSGGTLSIKKPEANTKNTGVFFITPIVAEKVLKTTLDKLKKAAEDSKKGGLQKVKQGTIQYKTSMALTTLKTENVLGYLEGSDKKEELVIITAHYDHIGKRPEGEGDLINNGADDDGSGTVSVMEIAKIFAQAKIDGKGPRRSILFMTVTGEEKGLLGSDYYTQNPIFPLANTVVDLNIDMVGRRDSSHKDSPPYVYVIGSDKLSAELHELSEAVNKSNNNLVFDYTYNDQNHPDRLYYRSDHWNFAKNNIPIIFYFDGIHEDYHKVTDEVSKIEFDLLTKRAQTIFYTAWEIANREQRIMPDKK